MIYLRTHSCVCVCVIQVQGTELESRGTGRGEMWRKRVKSCLVKGWRRCQGAKRERGWQRNGVGIEDGVVVLVTQKAAPACCSIDTDGATYVCASACQMLLSSPLTTRLSPTSLLLPIGIEEELENRGCTVSSSCPLSNVKVSALVAKFSYTISYHPTHQPFPALPVCGGAPCCPHLRVSGEGFVCVLGHRGLIPNL